MSYRLRAAVLKALSLIPLASLLLPLPSLSQTCPQPIVLRQETCPSGPSSCVTGGAGVGGGLTWQQLDRWAQNILGLCNGVGQYTWPSPSAGVLKSNGGGTISIATVGTSDVANDAITYSKIQNVSATNKLLGRASSGAGDPEEIGLGSGLSFSGGNLIYTQSAPAASDYTNLTGGAGIVNSPTGTIATDSSEADFLKSGALTCGAFTQGKVQVHTTPLQYCDNSATPALRYSAYGDSSGNALGVANDSVALGTKTTGNYAAGDAEAGNATGLACTTCVDTSDIANDAITYAKIQNVTSGKLLGRSTAGSGDTEEISVGSGLTLSGSTLSSTATGGFVQSIFKQADESVISSTTTQTDDYLIITLGTGTFYITLDLWGTADVAAGIVWDLSSTATISYQRWHFDAYDQDGSLSLAGQTFGSGYYGFTSVYIHIVGTVTITSSGTLSLKWAQANSNATATKVERGSAITAFQLN